MLPSCNEAAFAPNGGMVTLVSGDEIQIFNVSNGLPNSIRGISYMKYIPDSATFTEDGTGVVVVLPSESHSKFF